jgi:predicted transcriptional regulator
MPTAIDEAVAKVDVRIKELHQELDQLEKARKALEGVTKPAAPNRRRPTKRRRSSARSARVDRAAEFKSLIGKKPDIKPSQAAREMGVSSQQVHGLIKRLTTKGEITRSANGFAVKS